MKLKVKKLVELDVARLVLEVAVQYDEDDMPNDFPHRVGDMWTVAIDVDTGVIFDWPAGVAHDLCMKVVDRGSYYLEDRGCETVASLINDYVPSECGIGGGDYIDMNICSDGTVANWPKKMDFLAFFEPL